MLRSTMGQLTQMYCIRNSQWDDHIEMLGSHDRMSHLHKDVLDGE